MQITTPPYWLQVAPNRGTASTTDALPPKHDFIALSSEDLDYTLELLTSTGPDVFIPTDDATVQMSIWRDDGTGALVAVDTLTEGDGRIIVADGTVRFIYTAADRADVDAAELYYNLALTDAIPRTRQMLAGMMIFADRLRTVARCER